MSFLKRRKKEKTRRGGEAVAPVTPLQSTAAFSHTGEQIAPSHAEALTVHRQSQVSASTPDIYHEFSTLTDPTQHQQGPHRVSTPRKPKDYKRKRGIVSIFSRKKSSSLPQLPIPQALPPVPIPLHPDGSGYRHQVKHFTADTPPTDTTDAQYQNEHYMVVRTSTPLQSSEEPYPLYSTIRTDPVTGTKATVRNVVVTTPMRSVASCSSAPAGADRAVGEQLTAGDLSAAHREYENQVPVPAEAAGIPGNPLDTQNATSKLDSSGLEQTLQLLSRQQQQLLESLQLQQRSAGERDTRPHAIDAKHSEERHAKRQSRITADTDPTTSSLNQSADPGNSLLPGNKVDGMQYYFVPGTEGNGYLLPVGPEGRPLSKHNALLSDPIRTEAHSVKAPASDQLVQYLQERQVELESKLVELTEQNAQLSAQVGVMCRDPTPSDEMNAGTEVSYLRQECDRLREIANPAVNREQTESVTHITHRRCTECVYRERELVELKRIVFRLNVELSRYQSLYGEHPLVASSLPLQQLGSENAPWLSNTSYLSPLLAAYDEQLNEKSTLLRELQASVTELQGLSDTLESRNSELEREVTSRPLPDQLERSRRQLQLLKEENTILSRDLHSSQQELMQLRARAKHELEQSDERVSRLEREAERHKSHLGSLKSKLESERVSYSDKINYLKEQLHQTQSHSDSQCSKLQSKLREVAASISKKESMVCDQKAAMSVLEGKSSAAANSVRALKQKISILERELEISRSNELTAQAYLEDVVSLVERTATERDTYAKLASKHGHISHISSLQDTSMKRRLDKLRETAQIRMKISSEQDSINESDKQTNEDELLYIRSLLADKEREISVLREARETAGNRLDGVLLSLPKQLTNSI